MAALKFNTIFLALFSCTVLAAEGDSIKIDNQLSVCTKIDGIKILNNSVFPSMEFNVELKSPTSECGCKSALGVFAVYAQREGYDSYLMNGKISLAATGKKYIPLATDFRLIESTKLKVIFSCAQPD